MAPEYTPPITADVIRLASEVASNFLCAECLDEEEKNEDMKDKQIEMENEKKLDLLLKGMTEQERFLVTIFHNEMASSPFIGKKMATENAIFACERVELLYPKKRSKG